jgi:hypothetical protein
MTTTSHSSPERKRVDAKAPPMFSRRVLLLAIAVPAALVALAFGGVSIAGSTGATQTRGPVMHTFQLTDNPGNWFDSGTDIGGTRSLIVAQPGDMIHFEVGAMTNTVHTASSLLWPTGAANMPFDQPHAY